MGWLGIARSKFYNWRKRYGKTNEHNALIPRDHWIEPWEREAILHLHDRYPLEGYRRLTFMMLDRNVAAVSSSTTYRVLKNFKEFVRLNGLTHVRASPYYAQSNGKIERRHRCLKADCTRPGVPLDLEQARRLLAGFIEHYNTVRLHSAIGHITPQDKLLGREMAIFATREQTLAKARENRKINRLQPPAHSATPPALFSICR